jgi:hypothetical protein
MGNAPHTLDSARARSGSGWRPVKRGDSCSGPPPGIDNRAPLCPQNVTTPSAARRNAKRLLAPLGGRAGVGAEVDGGAAGDFSREAARWRFSVNYESEGQTESRTSVMLLG